MQEDSPSTSQADIRLSCTASGMVPDSPSHFESQDISDLPSSPKPSRKDFHVGMIDHQLARSGSQGKVAEADQVVGTAPISPNESKIGSVVCMQHCPGSPSHIEQENPVASLNEKLGKVNQDDQDVEKTTTHSKKSEAVDTAHTPCSESMSHEDIGKRCVIEHKTSNAFRIATHNLSVKKQDTALYEIEKQEDIPDNEPQEADEPQDGKDTSAIECENLDVNQSTGLRSDDSQDNDWIKIQFSNDTQSTQHHILNENRSDIDESNTTQVVENTRSTELPSVNQHQTAANDQSGELDDTKSTISSRTKVGDASINPKSFREPETTSSIPSVNPNTDHESQSIPVQSAEVQHAEESTSSQSQTIIGSQHIEFPINDNMKIECQVVLIRTDKPQPVGPSTGEHQASIIPDMDLRIEPRLVASFKLKDIGISSTEIIGNTQLNIEALSRVSDGVAPNQQKIQLGTSDSNNSPLVEPVKIVASVTASADVEKTPFHDDQQENGSNADKIAGSTMEVQGYQCSTKLQSSTAGENEESETGNAPDTTIISPPIQSSPKGSKDQTGSDIDTPKELTNKQKRYKRFLDFKKAVKAAKKEMAIAAALKNRDNDSRGGNEQFTEWNPTDARGDRDSMWHNQGKIHRMTAGCDCDLVFRSRLHASSRLKVT